MAMIAIIGTESQISLRICFINLIQNTIEYRKVLVWPERAYAQSYPGLHFLHMA